MLSSSTVRWDVAVAGTVRVKHDFGRVVDTGNDGLA